MAERIAASEFLYSKPKTENFKRDWLNHHSKKFEVLVLRLFLQRVLKRLVLT